MISTNSPPCLELDDLNPATKLNFLDVLNINLHVVIPRCPSCTLFRTSSLLAEGISILGDS